MKKLINAITYRLSFISFVCIILAVVIIVALFALNAAILEHTHGCYNIIDILFM